MLLNANSAQNIDYSNSSGIFRRIIACLKILRLLAETSYEKKKKREKENDHVGRYIHDRINRRDA